MSEINRPPLPQDLIERENAARLAALQVQQQLSLTNGAIASQSPNAILALFQAG